LVEQGQPLDRRQVAGTIDRFFSSGLYNDIQVDARTNRSGITLRFITRPRRFIGHVGARGDISDTPNRAVILNEGQFGLGTPYDEESLENARKNIEQELRQNGLFLGRVG